MTSSKTGLGRKFASILLVFAMAINAIVIPISPAHAANGKIEIDWKFVKSLEGGSLLTGYVPNFKGGGDHSGVTIAGGFDLGQQTVSGMRAMGLPESLIRKLAPYVGKRLSEARAFLRKNPLRITQAEANIIDRAVIANISKHVARDFNRSSKVRFEDLPSGVQTAIYSVGHQYFDLPGRTPRFFRAISSGSWGAAIKELRNFGAKDQWRNTKIANLLEKSLRDAGIYPAAPAPKPTTKPEPAPTGLPTPGTPGSTPDPEAPPTEGAPGDAATPTETPPPTGGNMPFLMTIPQEDGSPPREFTDAECDAILGDL